MGDIASLIRGQLASAHAQWGIEPSNISVDVHDFSSFVTSNNESLSIVAVATSSLTGLIGDLCRSSPGQRHVPTISNPNDFLPVDNQGQYVLCLHDNSLRISPSSVKELQDLVSSACECLSKVLVDYNTRSMDHPLDSLNLGVKEMGHTDWLEDAEYGQRFPPIPFDLDLQRHEENTDYSMTQIFMQPPTPSYLPAPFSPASPFSPDSLLSPGSISSGSDFCLSQSSTTSSLPDYWDCSRSDAFRQYCQAEQLTVSPQDVFAPIYDAEDPMKTDNNGLGSSPFLNTANLSHTSSPQIVEIAIKARFNVEGDQLQAHNSSISVAGAYPPPHLSPNSPVLDSRPSAVSRKKVKTSRSVAPYPSSSPRIRPSPMRNPSRKIVIPDDADEDSGDEEEDDEYSPVLPARKAMSLSTKKVATATPSPSLVNIKLGRGNKFPAIAWCDYCDKDFTRVADRARHLKTCKKNPHCKGQKQPCDYCGLDAPVRGDSAKRHWRSEACKQGAEERGKAPYAG